MITKTITLACTYQIKVKSKEIDFDTACKQLKSILAEKISTEEFNDDLYIISKEGSINIEKLDKSRVEVIITLFITTLHAPESPRKLFKQYMENHLLKIDEDNFVAKIIKRRFY